MLWGFHSYVDRKTGGQASQQFKYTYESKAYFNGLSFSLYSLVFSFGLLIPIFVAMTAGGQIAGEARSGTLRMMCIRPVSRVFIVISKFFAVVLHTSLMLMFFIGLNLLVILIFIGWGNIELYPGPLNLVDEPGKILRDEALWRFAYATLSGTWALLVLGSIGLLFSVLFESPVTAVVATLALYVTFYIIGRIEFFESLKPYFFTNDMEFWRDVFKPQIPLQSFYHYGCICGIYIFAALLAAVIIFERKDITS
jgi:ABC-2 type transport system permease protein